MFNVIDVIVIAIIGLATFLGYKKGFVKTSLGFLSFFLAVALTFVFYQPVMGLIKEQTGFEEWLTTYLDKTSFRQEEEPMKIEETEEEESYVSRLPRSVVELIGLDEIKENAKNTIVQKIVAFAVKLLAIVVVYISARVLLAILILVLDLIAKLPVLKQFNEILGLITGAILGLLRIYGLFTIITLLGSLSMMNGLVEVIQHSLIASFLYNHNLLLEILF